jgi:hypothetical protein
MKIRCRWRLIDTRNDEYFNLPWRRYERSRRKRQLKRTEILGDLMHAAIDDLGSNWQVKIEQGWSTTIGDVKQTSAIDLVELRPRPLLDLVLNRLAATTTNSSTKTKRWSMMSAWSTFSNDDGKDQLIMTKCPIRHQNWPAIPATTHPQQNRVKFRMEFQRNKTTLECNVLNLKSEARKLMSILVSFGPSLASL